MRVELAAALDNIHSIHVIRARWAFSKKRGRIMRKYLWLGAILSIAAALGVYWTAQFAARHPESFFSNCWSAARLGMYLANPGMPPPSPVGASVSARTTPCNAVPCAHHTPEVGDDCQPRLPRTTAPAV